MNTIGCFQIKRLSAYDWTICYGESWPTQLSIAELFHYMMITGERLVFALAVKRDSVEEWLVKYNIYLRPSMALSSVPPPKSICSEENCSGHGQHTRFNVCTGLVNRNAINYMNKNWAELCKFTTLLYLICHPVYSEREITRATAFLCSSMP